MKIKISKCSNYDATKGKDHNNKIVAQGWELQEIDWDENKLRELVTLNGISFNEYDKGHRINKNWRGSHGVMLDFDDGAMTVSDLLDYQKT